MEIAITPEIEAAARDGAWFVWSVSGGKDSGAALHAANAWLDGVGHRRDRRLALHADLGRAEWPDTLDVVRRTAAHAGVPVEVVASRNDLVWRFEDRWRRSLLRYKALETINLVPPWSSSSLLFCRSESKTAPLSRRKAALEGDMPVVGILGLRRDESIRRSTAAIVGPDGEMLRRNGRAGLLWNPIADWTAEQVFAYHALHGIPLHRAYGIGSTRLSCAYCTIASTNDLAVSYGRGGNVETFRNYVSLEIRSAFSFRQRGWLADVCDDGMTDSAALGEAKRIALERNTLQARIPKALLKAKTIRNIGKEDAATLAAVRRGVAALYGVAVNGINADEVSAMARKLEAA